MRPERTTPRYRPRPRAQIAIGEVRHTRHRARRNAFRYPAYFVRLPMRRLDAALAGQRLLSRNRFNLLAFHDADHGDRAAAECRSVAWIDALLAGEGVDDADGELWLHTFPRVLGYAFKPVSFWFCHRARRCVARGRLRDQQHVRRASLLPARAPRRAADRRRRGTGRDEGLPRLAVLRGVRRLPVPLPRTPASAASRGSTTTTARRTGPLLTTSLSGRARADVRSRAVRRRSPACRSSRSASSRASTGRRCACGGSARPSSCQAGATDRRNLPMMHPSTSLESKPASIRSIRSIRAATEPAYQDPLAGATMPAIRAADRQDARQAVGRFADGPLLRTAVAALRRTARRTPRSRSRTGRSATRRCSSGDIGFGETYIAGDWTHARPAGADEGDGREPQRDRGGDLRHVVGPDPVSHPSCDAAEHAHRQQARTSTRTTTSATRSTSCGSTGR